MTDDQQPEQAPQPEPEPAPEPAPEPPTDFGGHEIQGNDPDPPLNFGSQIVMRGGLPQDLERRIIDIEKGDG